MQEIQQILLDLFCVADNMPLYDILNEFQKGHSHIAVVYKDLNAKKEVLKKIKDGEQLEFKDSCKKKGKKASLEKGAKSEMSEGSDGGPPVKKSPLATPSFKKRHRGCSYCILDVENAPLPTFPPNELVVGVITMEDVIEELLQEEILDETDEYVNIHNKIKVNMQASKEKAPDANIMHRSVKGSSMSSTSSSVGMTTDYLAVSGHSGYFLFYCQFRTLIHKE